MTEHANEVNLSVLANCRLRHVGKAVFTLLALAAVGSIAAVANCQFVDNASRRFFQAYLVAIAFVLSISLGAMFFVLVQHLMRAGWAVIVRRFAEVFCLNILVVGLLFLPIAWSVWNGDGLAYSWADKSPKSELQSAKLSDQSSSYMDRPQIALVGFEVDPLTRLAAVENDSTHTFSAHKPYLNNTRFLIMWGILFAIWIGLAVFFYRNSVAQDKTRDVALTVKMEWWSGIAAIAFGFSLTFGAFDLLMMVDPTWFSTIFGVYFFAGCAVSGMATLLLTVLFLRRLKIVPAVFSEELQRDLGRLMFAFVFFWAYIGFSQYMLLWYADMPETTGWMVKRGMSTAVAYQNSWGWLAIFLLFAHFVIPFCGFMSRHVKSDSNWMIFWACWMLMVHFLDLYWIVIPETNDGFTISLIEIGTAIAVIAIYGIAALWIASRSNLFAIGDPRMKESITRHAMY